MRPPRTRIPKIVRHLPLVVLSVYHLELLLERIAERSLLQPQIGLRWLASLGLLYGFYRLRRSGRPWLLGRRAVVLWLLVAALHLLSMAPAVAEMPPAAFGAPVVFLVLLAVVAGRFAPQPPLHGERPTSWRDLRPAPRLHPGFAAGLSPRAPPI